MRDKINNQKNRAAFSMSMRIKRRSLTINKSFLGKEVLSINLEA